MNAERLKLLRKSSGITQQRFAEIFRISGGTIAMWETGKREPDNETLTKIADYFDVSVDYLLGRTENPAPPLIIPPQFDDVQVAFSDGLKDLSQEDVNAVANFIDFLKSKKK